MPQLREEPVPQNPCRAPEVTQYLSPACHPGGFSLPSSLPCTSPALKLGDPQDVWLRMRGPTKVLGRGGCPRVRSVPATANPGAALQLLSPPPPPPELQTKGLLAPAGPPHRLCHHGPQTPFQRSDGERGGGSKALGHPFGV